MLKFANERPTLRPRMGPKPRRPVSHTFYGTAIAVALVLAALGDFTAQGIVVPGGIPYAFVLFTLVLLGIGMFHHHTLPLTLVGAAVITLYTALLCPEFQFAADTPSLGALFVHEAKHTLLNLGGLILGFTLLADLFERSHVPERLVTVLPKRPTHAAFTLLLLVWVLSSFLDNIAGAMIGGVMAIRTFKTDLSVAFLAAIIAASNAGGAWSVLGDTTTTMMWIECVPAATVFPCIIAAAVSLLCFGFPAARKQGRQPIAAPDPAVPLHPIDGLRLLNVVLVLAGAVTTNVWLDLPFVGVWVMLLVGSLWRAPTWSHLGPALKGTTFLLSLVWCASLMPVAALPDPSWGSALGLGFLSSVFDNIPLTKLALEQGGYDWALLSFAVGFGGSMVWFGSSAGVTLAAVFPQLRNTGRYIYEGWPIVVAYVVAFFVMLAITGWNPSALRGH